MKKYLFFFFFAILIGTANAQWDFRASMGLNFVNMPNVRDYINENFAAGQQLSSFSSAIEFSGEAGYLLKKDFQLGLELGYELNSFIFSAFPTNYNFDYGLLMPTALAYYVIQGEGYKFKFGGGAGPRFISINETKYTTTPVKYSSTGYGIVLKADGSTLLSDRFYAYIGVDLRYNNCGTPKTSSSATLGISGITENIKVSSMSAGIKLGISFIL